jgi:arylformamidase
MGDLIDISQTLRPDLPVWPGDTAFSLERTWALSESCPVNVARLTLSTHTGAHADAPLHYDSAGKDCAHVALAPYIGPCRVVDARNAGTLVSIDAILHAVHPPCPPRILLRTYAAFPHDAWRSDWSSIDAALIEALHRRGVCLIGVDAPSLDPQDSKSMEAHHAVRAAGMAILEGLVLDHVVPGDYELIALPLKIANADASPVRAVLRTLPAGTP